MQIRAGGPGGLHQRTSVRKVRGRTPDRQGIGRRVKEWAMLAGAGCRLGATPCWVTIIRLRTCSSVASTPFVYPASSA